MTRSSHYLIGLGSAAAVVGWNPTPASLFLAIGVVVDDAVIGVEEQFLGVPCFAKLRRALPRAEFREVSPLFLELRAVKTAEEIRRLKFVTAATQRALGAAIRSLQSGTTGLDLERVLGADHADTLARLASLAHLYYTVGRVGDAVTLLRDTAARCERVLPYGDPLIQAILMFVAMIFILVNLLVDLTYAVLDPRLRVRY